MALKTTIRHRVTGAIQQVEANAWQLQDSDYEAVGFEGEIYLGPDDLEPKPKSKPKPQAAEDAPEIVAPEAGREIESPELEPDAPKKKKGK